MAWNDNWSRRRWVWVALAVYVLALAVRLAWLTEARRNPLYQWPTIDERTHHKIAEAIANGTAPRTAYLRAPLYLYTLAGIYKIVGNDSLRARYVQVFIASLAPVLVFLIGGRLFGAAVGVLAGLLSTVFWTFVFFSTELLDVSMACVVYLFLAWFLIVADDGRWWKWLVAGVLVGVGAITRPNILAYAPFLALFVIWVARRGVLARSPRARPAQWLRPGIARASLLTLGCASGIAPVALRNLIVANEPILIAAWGSGAFWSANNPHTDAKRMSRPRIDTSTSPRLQELREDPWFDTAELAQCLFIHAERTLGHKPTYSEAEDFYSQLAWDYIRSHPGKLLGDMFKRFCFTFNAYEYPFNKDLYHFLSFSRLLGALSWLHFGIICPIGVLGLLLAMARPKWPAGLGYYLVMIFALAVPGTLFPITSRYRLPVVYLLMPLVAYGAVHLVRLFMPPIDWRRVAQPIGILAGLAVFANVNVFGLAPAPTENLLPHFAAASTAVGRYDLADQASDEIERALADPNRTDEVPLGLMKPMFLHYRARGDTDRASRYGWRMFRRQEKAGVTALGALVEVLVRMNQPDRARQVLDRLRTVVAGRASPDLAGACLNYGRSYGDRGMLLEAARQYARLVRLKPDEPSFAEGLAATRSSLAALDGPTTTRNAQ